MAITYTWTRKKLKEDDFGDAESLQLVMQATDGTITERAGIVISFGGDDLKPIEAWTTEEIDTWAEQNRSILEQQLADVIASALETN